MDQNALLQLIAQLPLSVSKEVPGVTESLNIPGVIGIKSKKVPNPYANTVGAVQLSSKSIDFSIDKILAEYGDIPFGWFVGPMNTPSNLRDHLEARGIKKGISMDGMVLEDLNIPITTTPNIDVKPVSIEKAFSHAELLAETYGMGVNAEAAKVLIQGYVNNHIYFVYPKGSNTIVAWSTLVYIPGTHVVLLGGSATHPDWRGKNIYKSMVARRLRDAKNQGAELAVIQAVKETSAPICARLGFQSVCEFDLYFGNMEEH